MANYYLKLRIEILNDPTIATLPNHLWRRYIELYLSAKYVNNCGSFENINALAFRLRTDPKDLQKDIDGLAALGLIDKRNRVVRYKDEQRAANDQERKEYQREKERRVTVTNPSRNVTAKQNKRDHSIEYRVKSSRVKVKVKSSSSSNKTPGPMKPNAAAALKLFEKLELPITEPKRSALAKLPWIDEDYLAWVYKRWQSKPNADVGLLVHMIESHDKPTHSGYKKPLSGKDVEKIVSDFREGKKK